MPSASEELRAEMERRFGDALDDAGPMHFLEQAGYVFTRGWCCRAKPGVTCLKDMTRDEFECLLFLVHEWDFGPLVDANDKELN